MDAKQKRMVAELVIVKDGAVVGEPGAKGQHLVYPRAGGAFEAMLGVRGVAGTDLLRTLKDIAPDASFTLVNKPSDGQPAPAGKK